MGRYNFVSASAETGNAIQDFLMKREHDKRQAMLDEIVRQNTQADNERADAALRLQQRSADATTESNRLARENAEGERKFRRASTIATTGLPGVLDADTAGLLKGEGFGTLVSPQQTLGARTLPMTTATPGVLDGAPTMRASNLAPQDTGQYDFAGGTQYQNARAAEAARASEGEASRQAAAERATEANATREEIARTAAEGRADTTGLRNQMTQMQIDAAKEKADIAKKATADKAAGVSASRAKVRDLAQALYNDPELEGITGTIEGRRNTFLTGNATDALARFNQLVNSLSLEGRGAMKGQGQISDFEGKMLAAAMSSLNRASGSENVKKHLKEIIDTFAGDSPSAGGHQASAPVDDGGGWQTINGIRIREKR